MKPIQKYRPDLLARADFTHLLTALRQEGYRIVGPVVRDGTVTWDKISKIEELPIGWHDRQQPGHYRIEQKNTQRFFDVLHSPESLKQHTFAPREALLTIERRKKHFSVKPTLPHVERTAILGVRACDIAGLLMQDQIFLNGPYLDSYYQHEKRTCWSLR